MANKDNTKQLDMETRVSLDDLCVEEIRQLKIVRVKSVREGEDPSCSYNFCPSTRGVPDDCGSTPGLQQQLSSAATARFASQFSRSRPSDLTRPNSMRIKNLQPSWLNSGVEK